MKKPPEELARKLLAAGEKLTGTRLDVSIDEVATAAGVPRATLYYYFSGRDDLVAFYMNDKLGRVAQAVEKACAAEGTVVERLEGVLSAILHALAKHPALCVELPGALREMGEFEEVVSSAERVVLAPLRELLIEGRATGEIAVTDIDVAAISLMAALQMTGMFQIVRTGTLDADGLSEVLIPQLLNGMVPR